MLRTSARAVGLVAPVLALAFTACSPSTDNAAQDVSRQDPGQDEIMQIDKVPASQPDNRAAWREFAECMRDHGVDLPNPGPDGVIQYDRPDNMAEFRRAEQDCQGLMPNMADSGAAANPQQVLRRFAACMRQLGIDLPNPGSDGVIQFERPDNMAKFGQAEQTCQRQLS